MKKYIVFALILFSAVSLVFNASAWAGYEEEDYIEFGSINRIPVVDADKIPYGSSPINKLERGLGNCATFWMELPAEVARVSSEQNPVMGATIGVVNGTITSIVRGGTALFDTATFFAKPYDKPIMKPEYALNRADAKISELFW
jgi:putative exosortase-associated protein (TIGR04073 family)